MKRIQYCCLKLEVWGVKVKEMHTKIKHFRFELRKYRSRRDIDGVRRYNELRNEF